jgi:non-homologous end joining protein Ku
MTTAEVGVAKRRPVRARPQPSHMIELEDSVSLDDVDPVYFDKSYYIAPR